MGIQYLLWLQEIAEGLSSSIENFVLICNTSVKIFARMTGQAMAMGCRRTHGIQRVLILSVI